jgi:hypothetical protein
VNRRGAAVQRDTLAVNETLTIAHRYHGPPMSGHGGMTVGLCAELLDRSSVEVTLRAPPPLDVPITVVRTGDGLQLLHGEQLVADATATGPIQVDAPRPLAADEPAAGAEAYLRHVEETGHAFPTCFGCGPARPEGEGLRIFPGPVPQGDVVAAPWTPDPTLVGAARVTPRLVWAALDCPSGFAAMSLGRPGYPAVLARFRGTIHQLPEAGRPHAIVGWSTAVDGRKLHSEVALLAPDGRVLAGGRALWIVIELPPPG